VDADEGALDRDHDGAVGVGDEEAPLSEAELFLHVQLHHVGRAEMRRHHRQPADKASAGLRRRRRWERRQISPAGSKQAVLSLGRRLVLVLAVRARISELSATAIAVGSSLIFVFQI